ncbi:MAG: lipopolysaccharide kinase InaA family protein [Endozoicomonas sp.]
MITSSHWTIAKEYQHSEASKDFSTLDKVFSLSGELITSDNRSNVHKVEIDGIIYYVKRYTCAGKGLRKYIGRSRIRAEWENMLLFHKLGVPAANIVAYGEEKKWGVMSRGAMITEEVKNSKDLLAMAEENSPLLKNRKWITQVIQQVADLTRNLHQNRFVHTDLKWRNILVTQEDNPKVALIDCPAGSITHPLFLKRGIIKDLACLDKRGKYNLSKTLRMKFYTLYTGRKLSAIDKELIARLLRFFEGRE